MHRKIESMYLFDFNEFEAQRFSGKEFLDLFSSELINTFDSSADSQIKELLLEIDKTKKRYISFDKDLSEEQSQEEIILIEEGKYYCSMDIEYLSDKIYALVEMKIIYLFKFLEINLKKLIKYSFSDKAIKRLYKWSLMKEYFKNKNIDLGNLNGYNEIFQLKEVNNSLKHSNEISTDLKKKIIEFKDTDKITYNELNEFYSRIKVFPKLFIKEVTNAISTELYEFDNIKIDRMADEIAFRMEASDAELLIESIKSKYK